MRAALLLCAGLGAGCMCPEGYIDREAIAPSVEALVERHDAYVASDEDLAPIEREVLLDESGLLLHLVTGDLSEPIPDNR